MRNRNDFYEIKIVEASCSRIESVYPQTLIQIGSPNGAFLSNSISQPGKQPISSSFKDVSSSVNPQIVPLSPIRKSATVLTETGMDILI